MLLSLAVGLSMLQRPFLDYYQHGPYNVAVPKPESILGYQPGTRHTYYRDQEQVVNAILKAAPDRVKLIPYGKSWQGRPLRVLAISSPSNIQRLEQIQADAQAIANQTPGKDLEAIRKRLPAIVWINQCIHGNEPASFEAGMWTLYTLAASRNAAITGALDKTLVILNPVFNPDGHERFAVWYNSVANGSADPGTFEHQELDSMMGRLNHYRFDMNRDRVSMSQVETRQEVAEFLRWGPHVYVDQHGQVANYFLPPNAMSQNTNVDRPRYTELTTLLGRRVGRAFDEKGYTYYVRDIFDLYYPGYLDSWTSLSGAIGMTYETGGSKQIAVRQGDGTMLTLRDGIDKHFLAALALVQGVAENRDKIVSGFSSFKAKVVSGQAAGKFQRVVMTSDDPRPLLRLAKQLDAHGIRYAFSADGFSQPDAHDYWTDKTGSQEFPKHALVVDIAQPQGALAKALLEPASDFEPEFVKEQLRRFERSKEDESAPDPEYPEFYDYTGWALPYAHNLQAWWCESAPAFSKADIKSVRRTVADVSDAKVGWALPYTDQDDALAAFDLLENGVRVQIAPKGMKLAGASIPRGSFLVMRYNNDDRVLGVLRKVGRDRSVSFVPFDTSFPEEGRYGPGSENIGSMSRPKIGVVFGTDQNASDFGPTWYLMEQVFKLPFTPLRSTALGGDLSDYTAIVFPPGQHQVTDNLKKWIQGGGCAVVLGGGGWAIGERGFLKLDPNKVDGKDPGQLPGSLFKAELDDRFALSYGYGSTTIAVPVDGATFYKPGDAGAVVRFSNDSQTKKLLTGWSWPDDTEEALKGTVWLQDHSLGQGRAVIFTQDPTMRAMWPGLNKLFLNAILLGPG